MGYGVDDMWRVWSDLERKETELKWGGHQPGFGPQYNSMGRPANPSSHFNMGWAHEQMGRVNRLRQALNASGPMTQSMIARRLSGIDLSTIWHILVSACQDIALYYGGSVAAGAFVGGVGGAFFGGVGAIPGAAAGAAAGGYVGGWVMAMLGLKSLVEDLAQAIPEALRYYERGFLEAWGPTRHDHRLGFGMSSRGDPSSAAFYLANGHVIMISAILAALAAYLTKGKGDKAALLKEISQSPRLGPSVARWVEENEGKLRQHPALQSRGHGAVPREEPPRPKRGREPTKEPERDKFADSVQSPMIARDAGADYSANSELGAARSPFVFDEAGQLARTGDRVVFKQGNAPTCAPTSCGMILDTLGRPVDLAALVGRANVGANGMTANRVAALLRSEGVDASFKSRMTVQDLADATANGNPAIAAVRQGGVGHAIVIDGVTTRQGVPVVAIRDPWGQQYFEKVDVFNQRFLRQGIVINGKPK